MKNLTTEIKRVFLKLIYTKPIETINVSSICDELEIKRQTFYYHYRDIFELVDSIFEDYTNELIKEEMDNEYLKSICEFSLDNNYLISSCINGGLRDVINKFYLNLLLPYVSSYVYDLENIKELNNKDIKEIIYYHANALSLYMIDVFKTEDVIQKDQIINKIHIFLDVDNLERTASLYYERRREI